MITTDIINETYIRRVVAKHTVTIYDTQAEVISQYLNSRTGNLAHFIASRKFSVDGTTFTYPLLTYLRFLDIRYSKRTKKGRSGIALYNRVVWGVLYGEALPEIRFGITEDIKKEIHKQLLAGNVQQSTKIQS